MSSRRHTKDRQSDRETTERLPLEQKIFCELGVSTFGIFKNDFYMCAKEQPGEF